MSPIINVPWTSFFMTLNYFLQFPAVAGNIFLPYSLFVMEYDTHRSCQDRDTDMVMITIVNCLEGNYAVNRENKCLVGLLLSIRHISMSTTATGGTFLSSIGNRYGPGYGANQRQNLGRQSASQMYNRIATFADLKSEGGGRCFAVVLKTNQESNDFFSHCLPGSLGVGCVFLLEEPSPVESSLGSTSSVPVIEGCSRLLPLAEPYQKYIPTAILSVPEAGDTKYFAMHHAQVTFRMAMFQKAICGGIFCDRQNKPGTTMQRCGCFHGDRSTQTTIRCDVSIPVPPQYHEDSTYLVKNVRSWRTAQLFLREQSWQHVDLDDWRQQKLLREKVTAICDIINNNGGWCIVGWLRTGTVQDNSNVGTLPGQSDNLASINMLPHISYLFPNDPATVFALVDYNNNKLDLSSNDDVPVADVNDGEQDDDNVVVVVEHPEVPADDHDGSVEEAKNNGSQEEGKNNEPEQQARAPVDHHSEGKEENKNDFEDALQVRVSESGGAEEGKNNK
jgi:hypothetical protein